MRGAALLTDLCGFSSAAEEQSQVGRDGAEALHGTLQTFFERTIDCVERSGGDVVGFAGDGALAVWENDDAGAALHAATDCGRCLLRDPGGAVLHDGRKLDARIAIGLGSITHGVVGGHRSLWMPITLGRAVIEAIRADALRQRGCVVLGRDGQAPIILGADMEPRTSPRVDAHDDTRSPQNLSSAVASLLAPEIVHRWSVDGPRAFSSEFRQSTVVFLAVDPRLEATPEKLQGIARDVQRLCEMYEAWLYQIIRDDKGLTFVINFGAPTFTHENDAERALDLVREAKDTLATSNVVAKAGIASGSIFCGEYGTESRRHYAIVGPCINRAARLAMAGDWGQCLYDGPTRSLAERSLQLHGATTHLSLDGIGNTITFELAHPRAARHPRPVSRPVRSTVIDALVARARRPDFEHSPRIVVIEAEPGAGKSTVLRALQRRAAELGLSTISIAGQRLQSRTSFHSAQPLITWIKPRVHENQRAAVQHLLDRLDIRDASDTGTPGATESLAERLGRLLGRCLASIQEGPVLVVVEELQWVDSASWLFLVRVAEQAPQLTVVAARRKERGHMEEEDWQLPSNAIERLVLEPLDNAGVKRVICERLDAHHVSSDLLAFVAARAQGNPLFADELTRSLVADAAIRIERQRGQKTARLDRVIMDATLPANLEALLIGRFDRLDVATREVAKAAAVLGERFEVELLTNVMASVGRDEHVEFALSLLARAGWTESGGRHVRFKHGLYPEVIGRLLPPSQRRDWHRQAAVCLEALASPESLGRLAYHWSAAGQTHRALPLLEHAALRALRSQAHREAAELCREALAIRARMPTGQIDAARARTERVLGRALMGLTTHREADLAFRRAARTAGHRRSDDLLGFGLELSEYVLRRGRRALGYPPRRRPSDATHEALNAAADRSVVVLWLGQPLRYAQLSFAVANLGDRIPPCKESAWGITSVAYLLALTPARAFAHPEFERALQVARETGDDETFSSCLVVHGMALTAMGRPREALPILEQASSLSDALHDSFWRHRARFMWAEALFELGDNLRAAKAFDQAAALALDAEPGIYGFTRTLAAVAWARLGEAREALARIEGRFGVDDARAHGATLPIFAALGAEAQVRCQLGDATDTHIADVAAEIEAQLSDWRATMAYYAGVHGHAGLIEARLRALEHGRESAASAKQAIVNFARFCRTYPGGCVRLELARARWLHAVGRKRQALGRLAAARRLADASGQKFELERCHAFGAAWSR